MCSVPQVRNKFLPTLFCRGILHCCILGLVPPKTIVISLKIKQVAHKFAFFFAAAMTRNRWRRSLRQGCSVTSVIASTSTTLRTVPHKCRCPTPLHTLPTMAVRAKNEPTATSVRSLATGPNPVMMTRPFEAYTTFVRTITIFAHHGRLWGAFGVLVCMCVHSVCLFLPSVFNVHASP